MVPGWWDSPFFYRSNLEDQSILPQEHYLKTTQEIDAAGISSLRVQRRIVMRVGTILAVIVLAASALLAQTFRGTILGTVSDPSGALVSGAQVTVRNVNTGLERSTQTSADGSYSVPELPIGTYSVTISQSGFQTSVTSNVEVNVAGERRVDASLKPGQVSEQVEVSGETLPMVETTTNDLGGVLTQETVKDLPINGRDYTKLIFL